VKGIEIVHYKAAILIVKGETKDHKPVPGLRISADYTSQDKDQMVGKLILAGGIQSDVSFETQEDGRHRSSQLQPDREVKITAQAEGFEPATKTLKVAEGKTEELTLVLDRSGSAFGRASSCRGPVHSGSNPLRKGWSMHPVVRAAFGILAALGAGALPASGSEPSPAVGPVPAEVDFDRHVASLFGKLGCNAGSCHGSFQGRGGSTSASSAMTRPETIRRSHATRSAGASTFSTPTGASCSSNPPVRCRTKGASGSQSARGNTA